jgi:carbamoyltransferase
MIILGINAYHADSSAAIFVDGMLVAAIEEERFRRVKHWAGFPGLAIEFCIKEAGIDFKDVDHFAIGRDPKAKFWKKILYLSKNPMGSFSAVKGRLQNRKNVSSIENELAKLSGLSPESILRKIRQIEHHRSHIASSFFASPFEEAACISIDGSGDFTTTMTAVGKGNQFTVLDSVDFPHSLGIFYTAFTQFLGFPHYGDEYKVMGMAPYGEPKFLEQLLEVISLTEDGLFKLNLSYFRKGTEGVISYDENNIPIVETLYSPKIKELFGSPREKTDPLIVRDFDIAASVQKMTELTIFHMMNSLQKKTGLKNICISGGVAQNSVANGKIKLNTGFENIYIPSAGHDAGISMGAALYVQHQLLRKERMPAIMSAYTGSRYSNEEIGRCLQENNIDFSEFVDDLLFEKIVSCLVAGGVVGWFSGRAEFGPRALGGRSILADPRRKDAKELINSKIKRRESFRPFAPSILQEFVNDYFEQTDDVPFMEKVFQIKEDRRNEIPAVTHVDGSGRLQTVDKTISPRYYKLIETFKNRTGVPILLNTSFNENEPIVNHPQEALNCFLRTDMDMLVMENMVVVRGGSY